MIGYSLPPGLDEDIDRLESLVEEYRNGSVSAAELKARRVLFGVYEQRERGAYMVRVRAAAGVLAPSQLDAVAALSSRHGDGVLHLTTRQELQIHRVRLEGVVPVIRGLREAGLSSKGGGGNTVRNVTAPEDAGIDPAEVFDVTPYALSLTSRLLAEDDSFTLPRKFKIAFSGSAEDKGYATVADVGFIAAREGDREGFRVYAAGGMGAKSHEGRLLLDFIEARDVYAVIRAVKTLFWKYGNRKNKHAARLRFLWQSLGEEEFRRRFLEEYKTLKARGEPDLELKPIPGGATDSFLPERKAEDPEDFALWKRRFARPQKQEGLWAVLVPVELGIIAADRAARLARLLKPFGEDVLRMTKDQNFLVRHIPERHLVHLYERLKEVVEPFNRPRLFGGIISCAGASTCQLGICRSRDAALAVMGELAGDLDRLADLKIHVSGCPNACGQHPLADLGFFGKAARRGERLYPAYNVVAGAVVRDGATKFARKVGEVGARSLPLLVRDFLGLYLSRMDRYPSFDAYLRIEGLDDLKKLCDRHGTVPDFEEDESFYSDWGKAGAFSLAGRGQGECSAGLFDLIEVDLGNIRETRSRLAALPASETEKREACLRDLVFFASRMLLITRAVEPRTREEVYRNFRKAFLDTGLVDAGFSAVVQAAEKGEGRALVEKEAAVHALADRVISLYERMDSAFRFEPPEAPAPERARPVQDLRGVACPMNFVKTKIELSRLQPGDILEIWLDDGEPIENVPGSVREEGHEILEQKRVGDYWSVVIEKR